MAVILDSMSNPIDAKQEEIRALYRGLEDIKKLRIATGNRLVAALNSSIGVGCGKPKDEVEDKELDKVLKTIESEYKRITDFYAENGTKVRITDKKLANFDDGAEKHIQFIKTAVDYDLVDSYMNLLESENKHSATLAKVVETHPLWNKFFKDAKGCGINLAACCIATLNIFEARHASSFWRYAGIDVVKVLDADGNIVGEGRSTKHAKLTKRTVVDKKTGETREVNSLGYNPELKSYLLGAWFTNSYMKGGLRSEKDKDGKVIKYYSVDGYKYIDAYIDYRARLEQRADIKDYSNDRKNKMAKRYAVKQFLRDLWVAWRELEGLEVSEPYEVAKLGNKPHKYNEAHEEAYLRTRKKA